MKKRTILFSILFFVIIIGASFSYNKIKTNSDKKNNITVANKTNDFSDSNPNKDSKSDTKTEEAEIVRVQIPDFIVFDKAGNQVKISDFKGKVTIINIWATWCIYCIEEMPDFQNIHNKYKDSINLMMVNATDGMRERKDLAISFLEKNSYDMPFYYDEAIYGKDNLEPEDSVYYSFSPRGSLPATVVIDKKGQLAGVHMGKIDEKSLIQIIEFMNDDNNANRSIQEAFN